MGSKKKIEAVLNDLKSGKMIVLIDETHRENEGDLVMAAEYAKSDDINFMAREGCGLICTPIDAEKALKLDLPMMVSESNDPMKTKFTVSIDAKNGTTTGISMTDRAKTIKCLADELSTSDDFWRPGHVFPLVCHRDGLKARRGHTEASLELLSLAGLKRVGVICEIIALNGEMARESELSEFAEKHRLNVVKISDIVDFLAL